MIDSVSHELFSWESVPEKHTLRIGTICRLSTPQRKIFLFFGKVFSAQEAFLPGKVPADGAFRALTGEIRTAKNMRRTNVGKYF